MKDALGIVPPSIKARYEREEFVDRAAHAGRSVDAALKSMDPDLSCVFIRADIHESQLPQGAVKGRWHVRKLVAPPALPLYMPILAPGGGYRDPDSGILRELAEQDLRRPGVLEGFLRRGRTDRNRDKLKAEQRRDEMLVDLRAGKRVRGEGGLHKSFEAKRKSVK